MRFDAMAPMNPYASCLVQASAGSGKTFQLAQRFLALVAAGAAPSSILTVTFTNKAAAEMQERILRLAAKLCHDAKAAHEFDAQLQAWHQHAELQGGSKKPQPKSAGITGLLVLQASQSLRITTIDSLFLEWCRKFPAEASVALGDETLDCEHADRLVAAQLVDNACLRQVREQAWQQLGGVITSLLQNATQASWLKPILSEGIEKLKPEILALSTQETFLWYTARRATQGWALAEHPVAGSPAANDGDDLLGWAELLQSLQQPFSALLAALSNPDKQQLATSALASGSLSGLQQAGIITLDFRVSGNSFRGKKREALASSIAVIESALLDHANTRALKRLNRKGAALYRLHAAYQNLQASALAAASGIAFADLGKGCYRIFRGPHGDSVRHLLSLSVRHIMLDEFQDTSRLQWGVFAELALALVTGDAGLAAQGLDPTVFLVGDIKQSIYGFREADPEVMGLAAQALDNYVHQVPLNHSWRSAPLVLDYVNACFDDGSLLGFAEHRAATMDGQTVTPQPARIVVTPLVSAAPDSEESAIEAEARQVAELLASMLEGRIACPIRDAKTGCYRRLAARDCALLYRSQGIAPMLERSLRRAQIPCRRVEEHGYFARQEIKDALAYLRFIAFPGDVLALSTVLKSPLGGISDQALMAALEATTGLSTEPLAARALKVLAMVREATPPAQRPNLDLLRSHLDEREQRPAHTLIHELMTLGGAAYLYSTASAEVATVKRNWKKLINILLRQQEQCGGRLPGLVHKLEELAREDEVGVDADGQDSVTMMTMHKAKGLEFPLVFIVDSGRPFGQRDRYWLQGGHGENKRLYYLGRRDEQPPDDPHFQALLAQDEQNIVDECQRLLYVALTRASQYLVVTGHQASRTRGLPATIMHQRLWQAGLRLTAAESAQSVDHQPSSPWPIGSLEISSRELHEQVQGASATNGHPTKPASDPAETRPDSEGRDGTALDLAPRGSQQTLPDPGRIIAPSQTEASGPLAMSSDPLPLWQLPDAIAFGNILHAAMELALRSGAFDQAKKLWLQAARREVAKGGDATLMASMLSSGVAVLERLWASPVWKELIVGAQDFFCEYPYGRRVEPHLEVGSMDLVLDLGARGIRVVDYKATMFAPEVMTRASHPDVEAGLARLAIQRRYDLQVQAYTKALADLHPGRPIQAGILWLSLPAYTPLVLPSVALPAPAMQPTASIRAASLPWQSVEEPSDQG